MPGQISSRVGSINFRQYYLELMESQFSWVTWLSIIYIWYRGTRGRWQPWVLSRINEMAKCFGSNSESLSATRLVGFPLIILSGLVISPYKPVFYQNQNNGFLKCLSFIFWVHYFWGLTSNVLFLSTGYIEWSFTVRIYWCHLWWKHQTFHQVNYFS